MLFPGWEMDGESEKQFDIVVFIAKRLSVRLLIWMQLKILFTKSCVH